MILEGALLAAALQIKGPDVLTRNIKNESQVRGYAEADQGKPGVYTITIHTADGEGVGEEIIPITILPKKLILKEKRPRTFSMKFSLSENYEGPVYFCIKRKNDPGEKAGGLRIRTRTCYKRSILAK